VGCLHGLRRKGLSVSADMRAIVPGSNEDRMPMGDVCESLGRQIIEANANHTDHRIDLYREIRMDGRRFFVRVKFTVPFFTIVPTVKS